VGGGGGGGFLCQSIYEVYLIYDENKHLQKAANHPETPQPPVTRTFWPRFYYIPHQPMRGGHQIMDQ